MPTPNQPEVFGKYHLLEKIATGGMAEVFRARSYGMEGFEKILVVKRVLDHLAKDEEFIQLFQYEALIAVELQHVNIVQVFEFEQVEGQYYIAMEYVHGLDLARLLTRARRTGPFPIPLALFITCEVLKALQFAHDKSDEHGRPMNVVHCDISPQNILISYAGEVKITDFGISRAAMQAAGTHKVVRGKYAYMSPEQVEGGELDGRSDVFSLGIVLWELLAGRRLFKARTREETLARVRRAEVPSLRTFRSEVSEDLEGLVLKTLSRRASDRYTTAAELLEALSILVVREGHRATNNDLSRYLKDVLEAASRAQSGDPSAAARPARRTLPPSAVVVMAAEASPPPRSIAAPQTSLANLLQQWTAIVQESEGEIWESGDGSALVVWLVKEGLRDTLSRSVSCALRLQRLTLQSGYRLSAGIAPGVVRLQSDTQRPDEGWELAGPFYLSRWMMNLSAHRGRVLVTEVGKRQIAISTQQLGRIPIEGSRYINLYEVG